jgi:sugar phosphate isomerase/epimerase
MKWAISTLSFPDALPKKLEAAARAGFKRVEIFMTTSSPPVWASRTCGRWRPT